MLQTNANAASIQRRITLIRHAKAEEGDGIDLARRLNARGEGDAAALGGWLRDAHALPQVWLCSTAQRTRQTLAAFGENIPTILSERLYLASAKDLLKCIGEMDDAVTHLGVIGHNPGLHQLAALLVDTYRNEEDAERLVLKFPTATCAVFSLALPHWRAIAPRSAMLETLMTPKHYRVAA